MARVEADREDLMREAAALVERVSFRIPELSELVFCGFRKSGRFSIYCGADPVYQFDESGQLRRAYVQGELYRSQQNTLARLVRSRTNTATLLERTDLTPAGLQEFESRLRQALTPVLAALESHSAQVEEQVPPEGSVSMRVQTTLAGILAEPLKLSAPLK